MGLLCSLDISGHHFLICGSGKVVDRRRKVVERYNGKAIYLRTPTEKDLLTLGRDQVQNIVDGVFIGIGSEIELETAQELYDICVKNRIPINVADHPNLCTFSLPSIYEDGNFQIGVSTGGMGCRLANRIKRILVNSLPPNMGEICGNIGKLRLELGAEQDTKPPEVLDTFSIHSSEESHDDDAEQTIQLNQLVKESSDNRPLTVKRLRWLSQMVEYFPLAKLAQIQLQDLQDISSSAVTESKSTPESPLGHISLVGAGPGSAGLLTTEALTEIKAADYILADKLVPEEVLALIPRQTPVFIARKFPGNAEKAQQELLEKGLEAVKQGKHVVRLKQGDPYIYGRGAEEYIFFEKENVPVKVVAGVTSALAAPLLAKIPPTHRGYADQILICTGTGRAGALPTAPEWVPNRTTVFLMALHRIQDVSNTLINAGWDPKVPCASIERASCPEQRVIRTTLEHIAEALEELGSRPPGLLVVGYACEVIVKNKEKWSVEEGL